MLSTKNNSLVFGLILSLGIFFGSLILGFSFYKTHSKQSAVVVKGLAERDVKINLVVWPISYRVAANSIPELRSEIEKKTKLVKEFLINFGFDSQEIVEEPASMEDRYADGYRQKDSIIYRYTASLATTLRTEKVELALDTMKKTDNLLKKGLTLAENRWDNKTQYLFTKLNDIKPEMLEEATRNARKTAELFAKESNSKLGSIKHAHQGVFQIQNTAFPSTKKVRIVTTISYFLENK